MHFPCDDQQKQAKRINILLLDSPFLLEHKFQGTWQVGCSRHFGESQSFWEFNLSVPDWLYQGSVLVFCLAVGLIVHVTEGSSSKPWLYVCRGRDADQILGNGDQF